MTAALANPKSYTDLMPIEHIDDWQMRLRRQEAFWSRAILDRPVAIMQCRNEKADHPWPAKKEWASHRERWFDAEFHAEAALANVMHTHFLGDALPGAWPNLGPEVFSAFFGAELEYGPSTSWSIPNLEDWDKVDNLRFSEDNFYWRQIMKMTDLLLEMGRGMFYTGVTDLHPGGDAIAAFRDPLNLNIDMVEEPEKVKALIDRVTEVFCRVMDVYYDKLHAAGQALTTWIGITSPGKWYVPSNDFSCMVSKEMFDEIFLRGIVAECKHLDHSIYHLDGPGALRHLDSLLAIDELDAVQWVFGAGQGRATDWLDVYKKIQGAGKGNYLPLDADELDVIMRELKPEGLWLRIGGVENPEHAEAILKKLAKWTG